MKDDKYRKVRDYCHYTGYYGGAVHSMFNLKYSVPKIIPIAFHNGTNYNYHFIIKELIQELKKKQFTCLRENTEKYITITIKKEVTRIKKNGDEVAKSISYILKFTYSKKLMVSLLSNLASNLYERIHKIKCKCGHDDKTLSNLQNCD